jgi:hypothetical protein
MKILPFLGSKNFPTSPGGWALFEIAKLRLDGKDRCPLQSLGCAFRLSIEDPDMLRHIRRHDLKDRAAVPNILREKWIGTDCVKIGVAACPICKASICSENEEFLKLANHLVESHTEMERSTHIETISKILGVFYDERGDYFGPWTKSENERGDYFGPWTKSESERFHRGDSFRNLMQEDLVARFKGMWKHDKTSEYGYFRWLNICEQQNEILWEFARAQVRSAHALEDNSATVRTDKKQAPCKGDMKAVPAKLHGASRAP